MDNQTSPVINPAVVLREEFDDWAILFDPDSNQGFGLSPVGVMVWKLLDGRRTVQEIVAELRERCNNVPDEAEEHVRKFIEVLKERGLAGYEVKE